MMTGTRPIKVLLPNSIPLQPDLPEGAVGVVIDAKQPIPAEHLDAEVLVVWANRGRDLRIAAQSMPNLRLVQGLMAGPDQLLRCGFADDVIIASGVGLHDTTVSEHALGLTLALVREIPRVLTAQGEHRWDGALGGSQEIGAPGPISTLRGAHVVIWGFGSIAKTLAPMFSLLGATVTGVARSDGERAGYPVVDEAGLAAELARADVLVMILPTADGTRDALDAERLSQLKPGAFVVNVGRGTTVDEAALIDALESGHVAGAGLDVMQTEPLPADAPLWDAPNVILTPHVAGGRPMGADPLIAANVEALMANRDLTNRLERGAASDPTS